MNYEPIVYVPAESSAGERKKTDIREILTRYTWHWPLFVLCLAITFTLAFFYLRTLKPVYQSKAKISIKDDKQAADVKTALQELNVTQVPKSAENEIEILKSRALMREVVDSLQLWSSYREKGHYSYRDIYASSPVKFRMLTPVKKITPHTFRIYIKSPSEFLIEQQNGQDLHARFADHMSNDFGKWKLEPTAYLTDYVGRTVEVSLRNPEDVVSDYQQRVIADLNKSAPIVDLSLIDEVPERGEAVLSELIRIYKNVNIQEKNRVTESTLKFIDDRLSSVTGELNEVEKNEEGYKSSKGITDISSQSKHYLDNVQTNDTKLNEVNVQLRVIEGIEQYVNSPDHSGNAPATVGISDPVLSNLIDQLIRLQLQKEKLLATTPETNPIFGPINSQIRSTKASIKENVRGIKASLLATKRQLEIYNNNVEASIKSIPGQERQYLNIKRQQSIKEGLYVYLLQKREEVAMSYASTLSDVRTIEEPYSETPPSKKNTIYALSLLLGIGFPAGLLYLKDAIKNKVTSKGQIEAATSLPVIGELIKENSKAAIVALNRNRYAIGEQLRSLRTATLSLHSQKKGRVTLLTSSVAGEGKSFITSNLGLTLAASGRRTVILELDLRKPKISAFFNLPSGQPGLGEYLENQTGHEDIIFPSGIHDNLFIISAGKAVSNPSEILDNLYMESLIQFLKGEFDDILLDTPPMHLVTDARLLAPMADASLYLVRQGFTSKEELKFIEEVRRQNVLPNMALVFNCIERGKYGYGYEYNYSGYDPSNKPRKLSSSAFFARFW